MTLFPSLLRNQDLSGLLANQPKCWLFRASSKKGGGLQYPRLRSPPAPVGQALMGIGAAVFLASCVWELEGWVVGVGTSADLVNAVWAFAGMTFCLAEATAWEEHVSSVQALGCTLCGVPFGNSGALLFA